MFGTSISLRDWAQTTAEARINSNEQEKLNFRLLMVKDLNASYIKAWLVDQVIVKELFPMKVPDMQDSKLNRVTKEIYPFIVNCKSSVI